MLSVRAFSSGGAASKYYSHGDYYGQEGQGTWLGEGARELGLKGEFTASSDQKFNNLLNGILPDGQVLGRKTKDGIEHAPGIDLTFSAPKSFSIEMLVFAGKEQKANMEKALMNATGKTLSYVEKQGYVIARKGKDGYEKEPISKLSFATFLHSTNRNLEPQSHVHCFLANAAQCEDGKYRSLAFGDIFKSNKFLGQVFRNELALEVKKLGIDINTKLLSDGSSSFELSHIDPKLIDAFSTRRAEIEALCKLYGITTKEGRDKIVINSRKAKQNIKEEDLKQSWNEVASNIQKTLELDVKSKLETKMHNDQDHQALEKNNISSKISTIYNKLSNFFTTNHNNTKATENKADNTKANHLNLKDLAHLCIEDTSSRKSVFSEEELLKNTLKYSIGHYSVDQIKLELNKLEKSGVLIRSGKLFTTKAILTQEKQIIKYTSNSKDKSQEIIKTPYFDKHCTRFESREFAKNPEFKINDQQKNALKYILSSKDKIILMEGLPGVGKSTILNGVRDISGRKVISILGLGEQYQGTAPTASAAKSLKESAKVESSTLHSFLGKYQGYIEDRGKDSLGVMKQTFKKTVIFVDEASLISTKTMHQLLKLQDKFGFRLVLTGDTKQLGSVEAGKPFEQMLGILPSVKITDIIRQKNESHKEAVIASSEGKIRKTFEIHQNNIIEVKDEEKIAEQASKMFLAKNPKDRDNTLLISPTRNLRDSINNNIVDNLRMTNQLHSQTKEFTALRQKDITAADYKFASSFNPGDILKFNKSYKNGIEKGDYLKIKKISQVSNALILEKESNGKTKELLYNLKKM